MNYKSSLFSFFLLCISISVIGQEEAKRESINPKLSTLIIDFYNPDGDDASIYNNNSKEDFEAQIERAERFSKKLKRINTKNFKLADRVDYDYFSAQVDNQLQNLRDLKVWENNPSLYISFDSYFASYLNKSISDEERYIEMIEAIEGGPLSFSNGKKNLKAPASFWVDRALVYASNVERYYNKRMPNIIEKAPTEELKERMSDAVAKYISALKDYSHFLANDLMNRSSGVAPLGKVEYERALKNYFVDYSVEDLIKIGKELFNETIGLMEEIAKEINPNKTWQEIIQENRLNHVAPWELFQDLEKEASRAKKIVYEKLVNVSDDITETYHYTADGHPVTYPIGASGIGPFVFENGSEYHGYYALPTIDDYETLERKSEFMMDWNRSWYVVQQIL